MAKVELNPAFLEFQGSLGDMVFRKRNGKTYVSMKPQRDETREPSEAQLTCRQNFKQAKEYTKAALVDETLRAFYERLAQRKGTTPHALCMGDYLNPPTVDELDLYHYHGRIGDRIRITTLDDVGVATVDVTLTTVDGATIEKGQVVSRGLAAGNGNTLPPYLSPSARIFSSRRRSCDRPGSRAERSANLTVGMN